MELNMRKKIVLGLVSLIITTTSVLDAKADDFFDKLKNIVNGKEKNKEVVVEKNYFYNGVIAPFGGITWEDGLKDVVEKLLKIEGLEKLNLEFTENHDIISLKSIKIADLQKKVAEGLVKRNEIYANPKDGRLSPSYYIEEGFSNILMKYKDKAYKDVIYYPHSMFIEASPIMINKVPFTLRIDFENMPTLGLDKPNKVFKDKLSISYPLLPVQVLLESSSKTLIQEHQKEISEALNKKYGISIPKVGSVGESIAGTQETSLWISSYDDYYKIKYLSKFYKMPYIDMYRKHLDDFEINKNKDKKDLKDRL